MKHSSPAKLSDGIGAVLRELGLGKKIRQYEVLDLWKEIVGEKIAGVTEAERITRGVLFVRVARPTWRNELVYLKKELIEKINDAFRETIVTDIVFR